MQEIIKVQKNQVGREEVQTVNARELHSFLESKRQFADWIKERIDTFGFVENHDFVTYSQNSEKGRPTKEYDLAIDMAKELSMVERSDKGKQARQYFIECEKQAKSSPPLPPVNSSALILMLAQKNFEQEERLSAVESSQNHIEHKIAQIEAKAKTRNEDMFTVAGYAALHGIKLSLTECSYFGKRCVQESQTTGNKMDRVYDPRFGTVNVYHADVLRSVLKLAA